MKKQKNTIKVDPYTVMSVEFDGFPKVQEIKPLIRMILSKYKLSESEKNLNGLTSCLITLKKKIKEEYPEPVTEMQILRHVIDNADTNIGVTKQAAISAIYLAKYSK
ncbi:hypothetical protein [Chryseobacterium mulctrae]|uniref:hypothetical protein n=1 Tax=Chryseobacterium mulctrae TaxID=2576777 RepID=UPI001116514E|nr:hypothetical protein [Chryseobacterium mulctrae]